MPRKLTFLVTHLCAIGIGVLGTLVTIREPGTASNTRAAVLRDRDTCLSDRAKLESDLKDLQATWAKTNKKWLECVASEGNRAKP